MTPDYPAATNEDYLTRRAYIIVTAKNDAGLIDTSAYPPEGVGRPTIFDGPTRRRMLYCE